MRPTVLATILVAFLSVLFSLRVAAAEQVPAPVPGEPTEDASPAAVPDEPGPDPAAGTASADLGFPTEEQAGQQMLEAFAMSEEERAQYAIALRQAVENMRGKVMEKITAKLESKQAEKLDTLALALGVFSLSGVFLLVLPLVLRKKYPGKGGMLLKNSALAAVLFFLAVNLFSGVLFTMRGAQGALGAYTNPQVQIVSSTFDMFADKAHDLAVIGPTLVEPTLASLTGESDAPVLTQMLQNVQRFKRDFSVFTTLANFFSKVDFLFGLLPFVLLGIALVLFAKVAAPTLKQIAGLPERAAAGEPGAARATVRLTLRNVWAEAKAAFATMGVLVAITLIASVLLGLVLEPALEVFISYLTMALLYVQLSPTASSFWVLFSLGSCIVFLVLNLAVVIVASSFFLGKTQVIFQRKFREGVPLAAHARFWKRGPLATVWAQVLPVLYIFVAVEGIGWVAAKSMEKFFDAENPAASNWVVILASGPALFLLTFGVVFWAARGFAAIKYLARYKPALVHADSVEPAAVPPPQAFVEPLHPGAQHATVWESFAPPARTPSASTPPPLPGVVNVQHPHDAVEDSATGPFRRK
ncbi:MAG: hypothetical protein H0T89_18275 [Deltaproteobacteria bacterium]|nr:hypothetical protein [Deltaproteobacteria bacterium]MDQ3298850.1 alanine and proline-rich secreted protein Apa [Myxococcota bacterium]